MHLQFINRNKVDNVIFILSIFIAIIPFSAIIKYISFYANFIFILIIVVSIFLHIKKIFIPVWILNTVSLLLIILPFLSSSVEDIILPSIEALTLILSIRFLGRKTSREYFQVYLLSVLLLGGSSLFNMSWIFFIRIFLMLIFTVLAILLLTYIRETKEEFINSKRFLNILKVAVTISIVSIPLSALFFIILPRTPVPLMNIGLSKTKAGFSSNVNLGSVSMIEEDRSILMRVSIKKFPEEVLYWRVITFDKFDGKNWQKTISRLVKSNVYGEKINYTVTLEPATEHYLPALDFPSNIYMRNVSYEYPGIYKTNFAIEKTLKYNAISFINYKIQELYIQDEYLQLPPGLSHNIVNLTQKITTGAYTEKAVVEKILKFLSGYKYSLKNLPKGDNPVEDFLFNKKSGNCEYFATTMALMLRIKGIPSRVVGGFKGGTYNSFGNYYIVRASDAHLWVEAWINGQWIRFDPSGKIPRPVEPVIFHLIDYLWNSIVVDYDVRAQMKLAKSIKTPHISFNRKLFILPLALIIIFIIIKSYKYILKRKNPLNRFFDIMKKHGFERQSNQGLEEFISTIKDTAIKEKAEIFIKEYEEIYFQDKKFKKEDLKKLKELLKDIK